VLGDADKVFARGASGVPTYKKLVNANIDASAGIVTTKLAAQTASRVLVSDASGFMEASSVTTTTLGYLDATSSIQTQLNGKQATGNYITALTGHVTASGPGSVASTIANDVITNAMINSAAAIAYSKLNLSSSIVNADVSASAAIAFSKLATLTSGNILVGNGSNVAASVAMTGDVTISNAGVTAIGALKVTNAMLAGSIDLTTKVTGALPIPNGGSGQITANAALNAFLPSQTSNTGKVLGTDGSNSSWVSVATTVTTTLGDIIYHNGSTDARLAGNTTTTRKFLRQTGNGSVSAAPAWDTILGADVPLATSSLQGTVNFYEYTQNTSKTWAGLTTSPSIGVWEQRIGSMVNLVLADLGSTYTKDGSNGAITISIDANYRPNRTITFVQRCVIGGTQQAITWTLNSSGTLSMFGSITAANISAGQTNIGYDGALSFTYSVA
jgi:hypothetical protein